MFLCDETRDTKVQILVLHNVENKGKRGPDTHSLTGAYTWVR